MLIPKNDRKIEGNKSVPESELLTLEEARKAMKVYRSLFLVSTLQRGCYEFIHLGFREMWAITDQGKLVIFNLYDLESRRPKPGERAVLRGIR